MIAFHKILHNSTSYRLPPSCSFS